MKKSQASDINALIRSVQRAVGIKPGSQSVNVRAGGSVQIGRASGTSSVTQVSGHSSVVNGNEVWIDGERCYPKGLIEELDEAYKQFIYSDRVGSIDANARLLRARKKLGLA